MCNMTATQGECEHPECQSQLASSNIHLSPAMLQYFTLSILETTALLRQIVQNNYKIPTLLTSIVETFEQIPPTTAHKHTVILPFRVLHELIVHPEAYKFAYGLNLESSFPAEVCKGLGFEVILRLLGRDRKPFAGMVGSKYRALLYSNEYEMKPLEVNLMGRRTLTGTTEAVCGSDSSVRFPSLIINEVSSHYRDNALSLVIVCLGSTEIRPYVRRQVQVKSRRTRRIR